jgi:ankyrin repeat protein
MKTNPEMLTKKIGDQLVYSCFACVQLLAEKGAEVQVVNLSGDNALNCAAKGGLDDIVSFLLQKGVSPLQVNNQNQTVLDLAVMSSNKSIFDEEVSFYGISFQAHQRRNPANCPLFNSFLKQSSKRNSRESHLPQNR